MTDDYLLLLSLLQSRHPKYSPMRMNKRIDKGTDGDSFIGGDDDEDDDADDADDRPKFNPYSINDPDVV